MSLVDEINKNVQAPPYSQWYKGPIPKTIPAIKADGRKVAGGTLILQQILDVFKSGDKERIKNLEKDYVDLTDAIFTFEEDKIKTQLNSPFLTGIIGIVETSDGLYVAVGVKAVENAIAKDGMKYFEKQISQHETVKYEKDGKEQQQQVKNVVLFPYNGTSMEFKPDQWEAIPADVVIRKDIICGKDLEQEQVVDKDGKVVAYPWTQYPSKIIVPLVNGAENDKGKNFDGVFKYNETEHNYTANMGFFPADPPSDESAEMRALCVGGLDLRFGLFGGSVLGDDGDRLVGVVEKGVAQKLPSPLESLAGKGTDVSKGIVVVRQDQISPEAYKMLTQKT